MALLRCFTLFLMYAPSNAFAPSGSIQSYGQFRTTVAVSPWIAPIAVPRSRAPAVILLDKRKQKPAKRGTLDFSGTGSTDASGYRRGSFGIGKNESIVIYAIVALALTFGGAINEETAQKIREAQQSFLPKPPGYEKALKLKSKSVSSPDETSSVRVFP